MIVFELSMPNKGSWNGKWSQEGRVFARTMSERKVPKELWDKSFYHRWDDGWTACVSCRVIDAKEAAKLRKKNRGFCGYDWMVRSIIAWDEIKYMR